ncbi:MAG: sugar transferase [Phycisphaerae bacterium]|nr:sugar transferase [Phycisphaerae bacterium]
MKRLFDIVLASLGLLLVGLPMLAIALVIRLTDRGPVFYRQERVGRGGRPFRIFKFRTMVVGADRMGAHITVGRDPRITRIGHLLRKTKIDELPQLLNVLGGTMSFVGPRPEVPKYVAMYDERQRRVLEARPGITDVASIKYRDEQEILAEAGDDWERVYVEQVMPDKLRLNLEYLQNRSLWTDLKVILKTVLKMVS